jgi:hypothetical protein
LQYLKFLLLIVLDIVFSGGASLAVLVYWQNQIEKGSSCGTGSLGDMFVSWIVAFVLFLILLVTVGFGLHILLF